MSPALIGMLVAVIFLLLLSMVFVYLTLETNSAEEREAREMKEREEKEKEKEKEEMEKKKKKKKKEKEQEKKQKAKLNEVLPATALASTQGKATGISTLNNKNRSQKVTAASPYLGPGSAFAGGVPLGSQQNVSGLGPMQQGRPARDKIRVFDPSMVKNSRIAPAALITQEGVSQNVSIAPLGSVMPDIAVQGMLPINQDLPTDLFTLPKAKATTGYKPAPPFDTGYNNTVTNGGGGGGGGWINGAQQRQEQQSRSGAAPLTTQYQEAHNGMQINSAAPQNQYNAARGPIVFKSCQAQVNLWKRMEIKNPNIIQRGPQLAQGVFTELYKGQLRGLDCMIKLYRNTASAKELQGARREIRLTASLDHPCTLRLLGWTRHPLQTLTEPWLGNLSDFFLGKIEHVSFSERRALRLLGVRVSLFFFRQDNVVN